MSNASSRIARVCAVALLGVTLGLRAIVPHAHAAPGHEPEICSGHLTDHATKSIGHSGECLQCRTNPRSRVAAPTRGPVDFNAAPALAVCAAPEPVPDVKRDCSPGEAPRAPPGACRSTA